MGLMDPSIEVTPRRVVRDRENKPRKRHIMMDGLSASSACSGLSLLSLDTDMACRSTQRQHLQTLLNDIDEQLFSGTVIPEQRSRGTGDSDGHMALRDAAAEVATTADIQEWSRAFPHLRAVGSSIYREAAAGDVSPSVDRDESEGDECYEAEEFEHNDAESSAADNDEAGNSSYRCRQEDILSALFCAESTENLCVRGQSIDCQMAYGTSAWDTDDEQILAQHGSMVELIAFDSTPQAPLSSLRHVRGVTDIDRVRRAKRREKFGYAPLTPRRSLYHTALTDLFESIWRDICVSCTPMLRWTLTTSSAVTSSDSPGTHCTDSALDSVMIIRPCSVLSPRAPKSASGWSSQALHQHTSASSAHIQPQTRQQQQQQQQQQHQHHPQQQQYHQQQQRMQQQLLHHQNHQQQQQHHQQQQQYYRQQQQIQQQLLHHQQQQQHHQQQQYYQQQQQQQQYYQQQSQPQLQQQQQIPSNPHQHIYHHNAVHSNLQSPMQRPSTCRSNLNLPTLRVLSYDRIYHAAFQHNRAKHYSSGQDARAGLRSAGLARPVDVRHMFPPIIHGTPCHKPVTATTPTLRKRALMALPPIARPDGY